MTRIFTGDFSTADFSQWPTVSNAAHHGPSSGYTSQSYPARTVSDDKDCGYAARFEVRVGDFPYPGSSERSEVWGETLTDAPVGSTRWYAWSTKLDPSFPSDHGSLGWGVTTQFHDSGGLTSPTIAWGWVPPGEPGFTATDGFWYLTQLKQSAPAAFDFPTIPLLKIPINRGNWWDIKMCIKFKTDDTGTVQCWLNGALQTLLTGGTTFTGQTLVPTATAVRVQQGYYRQDGLPTGVVYHTGFRMADSEDSL